MTFYTDLCYHANRSTQPVANADANWQDTCNGRRDSLQARLPGQLPILRRKHEKGTVDHLAA